MKSILLLIFFCLAIAGCKKEKPHCWKCSYTYTGSLPDKTGDTILCNFTKSDIEIRQDKTFEAKEQGYYLWKITNCKQQ